MARQPAAGLSRREREIMDAVHRLGRAGVHEVMRELSGTPAYSTVRAQLRVLEVKAVASEEATSGTDLAMKLCGGAAFRKGTGIQRHFRDSLAARVMAPTTDALLDFVGRAVSGLPLLGPVQ